MSYYPNGLIPFGPWANCTLELCPIEWSVFQYQPSIAANAAFIALFGILLAVAIFQGVWYKTWGCMACVSAGSILQTIGYTGRILLHGNAFGFNAFLIQIVRQNCEITSAILMFDSLHDDRTCVLLRCRLRSLVKIVCIESYPSPLQVASGLKVRHEASSQPTCRYLASILASYTTSSSPLTSPVLSFKPLVGFVSYLLHCTRCECWG
jgi:hypothetical protein